MRIVWRLPDGSIVITVPASPRRDGESDDAYLDRIAARVQEATPSMRDAERVRDIATADLLPVDRTFRDAWAIDGDAIAVDMSRAREIQRNRLRALREPVLAALDVDMLRAIESQDAQAQARIAAQKQALRDVTRVPEIDAADSPEDLKEVGIAVIEQARTRR
jgi:hypothetical protein